MYVIVMEYQSTNNIFERLKIATSSKNDSELSRKIGLSKQSISSARKKGKVPESWIAKISNAFSVSMDWLRWGTGPMKMAKAEANVDCVASKIQGGSESKKQLFHGPEAVHFNSQKTNQDVVSSLVQAIFAENQRLTSEIMTLSREKEDLLREIMQLREYIAKLELNCT